MEKESAQFKGEWRDRRVATSLPIMPHIPWPEPSTLAELAWFELADLTPGECVDLRGEFNATFYKTEEDKLVTQMNDGLVGWYTHDGDDLAWDMRRLRTQRLMLVLLRGDGMMTED